MGQVFTQGDGDGWRGFEVETPTITLKVISKSPEGYQGLVFRVRYSVFTLKNTSSRFVGLTIGLISYFPGNT